MAQSDWIGLGTSVGVHLLVALLCALWTASSPEPPQFGFVEVQIDEFAPGQPVQAVEEAPESSNPQPETPPEPTPEETTEEAEPQDEPVELPDQEEPPPEDVPPTEEEVVPPEPEPEPQPEQGAEEQDTNAPDGEAEGDPGTGTTEEKSAPYNIEGLDRDPVFAPLPEYPEKVNARIRVRITVDPQGRIVRRIPLLKGSPELEQAVMNALQQWRFNRLPSGAPQENQTGVITFVFRVE